MLFFSKPLLNCSIGIKPQQDQKWTDMLVMFGTLQRKLDTHLISIYHKISVGLSLDATICTVVI